MMQEVFSVTNQGNTMPLALSELASASATAGRVKRKRPQIGMLNHLCMFRNCVLAATREGAAI